ncbi:MAG: winged helix-turn-helix transcriptional regulator, partial [Brochothrix sp.]
YNQVPPKVQYSLSDYGESLSVILNKLCLWGEQHVDRLENEGLDVCLLSRDEKLA